MATGNGTHKALISVLLLAALANASPTIRIQVNNENLKNAPYLLEASKQQEHLVLGAAASAQQKRPNNEGPASPGGQLSSDFNLVKEETIEEILDLDSESVMKLAPHRLLGSAVLLSSEQPQSVAPPPDAPTLDQVRPETATNNQPLMLLAPHDSGAGNKSHSPSNGRKPASPQLPVANSHLKKPASIVSDAGDEIGGSSSKSLVTASILLDELPPTSAAKKLASSLSEPKETSSSSSSGAKSLMPHTFLLDEPTTADYKSLKQPNKLSGQEPPDVLEPSQKMSGVSNASLVPAIINRDYGSQTRTRVTLGGGYQRDRQPAPEEQVNERTESSTGSPKAASSSGTFSHLVELPERIILPVSVLSNQQPGKQVKPIAVSVGPTNQVSQAAPVRRQKLDSRCPKEGVTTFEHPSACDKYFYCEDGYLSEQSCPNGLLYGTRETVRDYCVHRWKATCDDRAIPNPISSPGCRWQFGIFSVQGSPKCTPDFYECTEGRFEVRKCSIDGQVYDDRTKSCQYSELVGCAQEALGDFQCPPDDQANTYWPFPRYFLNERALIHCINDRPEIVRCTSEERVDPEHLHCVQKAKLQAKSHGSPHEVPAERRAREHQKVKVSSGG